MIVWTCWKCHGVVHRMPGTFEAPIGNWDLAWTILNCKHCGVINKLDPPGMKAALLELPDTPPIP